MEELFDQPHQAARTVREAVADISVYKEKLEKGADVGAVPVTVDVAFCSADRAAGDGPVRQVPVVQSDGCARSRHLSLDHQSAAIGQSERQCTRLKVNEAAKDHLGLERQVLQHA